MTLLWFQNASWIAPLANCLVIPIVGFVVVPLSLLASACSLVSLPLGYGLFHAAAWVLQWVWWILSALAKWPLGSWQHAVPSFWTLLSGLVAVLLFLAPRAWPARWLGIIFLLPLIVLQPKPIATGSFVLTLLDVGQGLASVVQTSHHTLVFDTGAKFSPDFDLGTAVVVPFLRQRGVQKIDTLMISHGDNDHIGGAAAVLQAFPVTQVLTSVPDRFAAGRAQLCLAGQQWQWDGVTFQVLYPTPSLIGLDNNSSCVLKITAGAESVLFTGDIEHSAEQYLVGNDATQLPATVIVAPHHGSSTSSSPSFLAAVKPRWVLFPVGYLNRYHFPSPIVVQRYQQSGACTYTTDSSGAITMTIGTRQPLTAQAYRIQNPRFWRWRDDTNAHSNNSKPSQTVLH